MSEFEKILYELEEVTILCIGDIKLEITPYQASILEKHYEKGHTDYELITAFRYGDKYILGSFIELTGQG